MMHSVLMSDTTSLFHRKRKARQHHSSSSDFCVLWRGQGLRSGLRQAHHQPSSAMESPSWCLPQPIYRVRHGICVSDELPVSPGCWLLTLWGLQVWEVLCGALSAAGAGAPLPHQCLTQAAAAHFAGEKKCQTKQSNHEIFVFQAPFKKIHSSTSC